MLLSALFLYDRAPVQISTGGCTLAMMLIPQLWTIADSEDIIKFWRSKRRLLGQFGSYMPQVASSYLQSKPFLNLLFFPQPRNMLTLRNLFFCAIVPKPSHLERYIFRNLR